MLFWQQEIKMNFLHCRSEEAVKAEFRDTFFHGYCYSPSKIDVVIRPPDDSLFHHKVTLLWAESKKGNFRELDKALVQLFLTIGQTNAFSYFTPPTYIAAFDAVKIIFLPYSCIANFFLESAHIDFSGTPSNYEQESFKKAHQQLAPVISANKITYKFDADEKELGKFIKDNILGQQIGKQMEITRNNLIAVCSKWRKEVMPTINVDWDKIRKQVKYTFVESDLFMADLLSADNMTIIDKLKIKLESSHYTQKEKAEEALTGFYEQKIDFTDGMKAHNEFWKRYKRPPEEEIVKWVMERKDLLQPQTVRERKGSFFTPQIWVQKSQEALAEVLGEEWQDNYYIWDCCAGTGNMEVGLTNKNNIFASTIDEGDVAIMHEQILTGNAQLFEDHVFQFDFLNDPFFDEKDASGNVKTSKLPPALQNIIRDPAKRKKLVVYINPPYAEATSATTVTGTGANKTKVATENVIHERYKDKIGKASKELFALFFIRIYQEIPDCILAEFSTLKILQSESFSDFRSLFKAKLEKMFVVPAKTFDNVKGSFPIGFMIWNTAEKQIISNCTADVYSANSEFLGTKGINFSNGKESINRWIKKLDTAKKDIVGYMENPTPDFQNNKFLCITNNPGTRHNNYFAFSAETFIFGCIYFAIRHCIEATWLNDRDQFLSPNDGWKTDKEFQADCLGFTLFSGQNRITSSQGVNHWIPFTEEQVGSKQSFESHFMSDFIAGKIQGLTNGDFFEGEGNCIPHKKMIFSQEAKSVMDAGLEIWKYYFQSKKYLATFDRNASFYDIRKVFQGENSKGRMNPISDDSYYNDLLKKLREVRKDLTLKIAQKVYEYGFLQ